MGKVRWPGLIDVHVHLRDPGATHKEDFRTASRAAVKGGFLQILDMPNNPIETITVARVKQKVKLVKKKSKCFIGFHMGTNGKNIKELKESAKLKEVFGLKIYFDMTTGGMMISDLKLLEKVYEAWDSKKPILAHAEGMQLAGAIALARVYDRRLHVCHVSLAEEVELIKRAKKSGPKITAGTTPHHLFLTKNDEKRLKGKAIMKPPLGTKKDQQALWKGLKSGVIDLVESDHAPHTKKEKTGKKIAFGVPGLESTLGLMLRGVKLSKCSLKQVKKWLYHNPKKIFRLKSLEKSYIEFDPDKSFQLREKELKTKCGWTSFTDIDLFGQVEKVVFNGRTILLNGDIIN